MVQWKLQPNSFHFHVVTHLRGEKARVSTNGQRKKEINPKPQQPLLRITRSPVSEVSALVDAAARALAGKLTKYQQA